MTNEAHRHPNYLVIWLALMALAIGSVLATKFPFSETTISVIVIGAAFIKAYLVLVYFMHLRHEGVWILALVATPVLLFVIMTVTLIPDLVTPLVTG